MTKLHAIAAALPLAVALTVAPPAAAEGEVKSPLPGYVDGRGPTGPVELTIVSPKPDEVIPLAAEASGAGPGGGGAKGGEVSIRLELKNFELYRDEKTQTGQHVHIVLDNVRHFEQFDLTKAYVLRGIAKGTHTLRVFPARPWHESIKEPKAFATVTFHVGEKNGKYAPEAGAPLLTANAPQGKIPAAASAKLLFDFLVTGCTVAPEGTQDGCQVRYKLDDQPEVTVTTPGPFYWENVAPGKHRYIVALSRDGKLLPGPFNAPTLAFEIV
ncbi:hypothetical protein FBQ97_16020, partial [Acidobacteria bacterium ACD]|nr:hypothetical protein [Acidobacteria bacterium ACD]